MFEKYASRLSVVVLALTLALLAVFWPALVKIFRPSAQIDRWTNLNPGIDIVGGTSLLYQIQRPAGAAGADPDLATKVMNVIKKRVDPYGTRNLIWRPEGDKLEIQMPFSAESEKANAQLRILAEQIADAQTELKATNIRATDVISGVEGKNGFTRADLPRLADGDPVREAMFKKIVEIADAMTAAHKAQDALKEASLRAEYQKLTATDAAGVNPIEITNLSQQQLDGALTAPKPDEQIKLLKDKFAGFPARIKAIDNYVNAERESDKVRQNVGDVEDLKRQLKGSGVLEFHIVVAPENEGPGDREEAMKMHQRLDAVGPRTEPNDRMRWFQVDKPEEVHSTPQMYQGKAYVLLWTTPERSMDHRAGTNEWHLTDAGQANSENGQQVVTFGFDPTGGLQFGTLTGGNLNQPMAVVLDNKVINVATIQSRINDRGQIDGGKGGFSQTELSDLINKLSAGSLPAQLADEPISEQTVGPQLGADNLKHGLLACALGLVVVAVFLISYYYLAGIVATFAVFMNVLLILGTMAAYNATFTLPSIAGIVLTIGTAVDANVLIFERLREEQHRGLSLRLALRNAYGKAFSAIVDSNMTTVITSLALIAFGTEEVKGFGITLIIGIVASLFTALFVTRTIFDVLIDGFGVNRLGSFPLSFPKWDRLLRPSIDWMRLIWGFVVFSIIAITVGIGMFVQQSREGHMLDIEFASGTSVDFELNIPMDRAEIEKLFPGGDNTAIPSPSIVAVSSTDGRKDTAYEIITTNQDSAAVKKEVIHVLGSRLKAQLPSDFDFASKSVDAAMDGKVVIPITGTALTDHSLWPGGFIPPSVKDYVGGVAIVLDHIDPKLKPSVVKQRITELQLQSDTPAQVVQRQIKVESPSSASAEADLVVVLTSDDALAYDKDAAQWKSQLAQPTWKLVCDAINHPPQLQKIENFNSAVAGDTQKAAFGALGMSILAIMAYIWFRFGNLKYGTATVVALLHDTLFVIAALGFAHYLVLVPGIRDALQLEPFRINLVVVAGILTIMGYSMIDTIVVFDRIRENRGKYGLVSRSIINDAVNQTLSRTLLTAGTTTVTVAIMYFFGGPGIHGFTFVLLVGILVGTYSSVAIAAPILLFGNSRQPPSTTERSKAKLEKAGT